jgi:hypothetical protein
MQRVAAIAALALSLAVAPLASVGDAAPQPTTQAPANAVLVAPGEQVEVAIGANDTPVAGPRGPLPADIAAALPHMDNSYERTGQMSWPGPPPTPGKLVFELVSDAQNGARLVLLNGYDGPVIYTADLVFDHGGQRYYLPTSICPVRARTPSMESWGNAVAGIAITGVRQVDAAHMACNDGSLLSVQPTPTPERYACSSADPAAGALPPFAVTLIVDAAGAATFQGARWTLSRPDISHSPAIAFDYAMEGSGVTPGARGATVFAMIAFAPAPPKAKTADIVLLVGGAEVARRPWRMYAQNMAALSQNTDPARRPAGFFGVIPFQATNDPSDAGLRRLLGTVGNQPATVDVRIVGDDGSVLADGSYDVANAPIHDQALVSAAVQRAQALARTPTQCRKVGA